MISSGYINVKNPVIYTRKIAFKLRIRNKKSGVS